MASPARLVPSFDPERTLCGDPALIRIAGVDEVGRGPLAGPVTAAAVRLDPARVPAGLNDSKALKPAQRETLAAAILEVADVCIAHASVEEIDEINILQATYLAMRRAVAGLAQPPEQLLIDGNRVPPGLPCPAVPLVKGDAKSLSVAAASIVAKVARDRIMADLAAEFPGYGWERNAGYPTKAHVVALKSLGITPYHRRSFAPVHKILCGDTE
ncbi:ribonuclease HII [Poseidonocella sp. HB161398]|uniref:ribonuclease HII n=1 Tax=Poseidonocella sp. HB161398 TaxID=2320855 RepID=UPI001109A543|nr:ribonuclease HII [Poseidonocella sp. HB161398]